MTDEEFKNLASQYGSVRSEYLAIAAQREEIDKRMMQISAIKGKLEEKIKEFATSDSIARKVARIGDNQVLILERWRGDGGKPQIQIRVEDLI